MNINLSILLVVQVLIIIFAVYFGLKEIKVCNGEDGIYLIGNLIIFVTYCIPILGIIIALGSIFDFKRNINKTLNKQIDKKEQEEYYKDREITEKWEDFITDKWLEMREFNPEIKMSEVRAMVLKTVKSK